MDDSGTGGGGQKVLTAPRARMRHQFFTAKSTNITLSEHTRHLHRHTPPSTLPNICLPVYAIIVLFFSCFCFNYFIQFMLDFIFSLKYMESRNLPNFYLLILSIYFSITDVIKCIDF